MELLALRANDVTRTKSATSSVNKKVRIDLHTIRCIYCNMLSVAALECCQYIQCSHMHTVTYLSSAFTFSVSSRTLALRLAYFSANNFSIVDFI